MGLIKIEYNIFMKIEDIIDLEKLLQKHRDINARRVFGLKCKKDSLNQLLCWIKEANIKDGAVFERALSKVTYILFFLSFILGFATGFGLLKFSLSEYVNIVYILIFSVFIPLVFALLNLLYIFKEPSSVVMPANIVQKLISFFTKSDKEYSIDSRVLYFYNLKSASFASVLFSSGLLLAIVVVGIGKDIPFGWSTTLPLSSDDFYKIIKIIAAPFGFLPNMIPSKEIIEASRYYSGVVKSAGGVELSVIHYSWWRFLIVATLFYGVILRLIVAILANLKYKKVLKNTLLTLNGVDELLNDFNTPVISTYENRANSDNQVVNSALKKIDKNVNYDAILGWATDIDKLLLIKDKLAIDSNNLYSVGGLNSIEDDLKIIDNLVDKEVGIVVNSYEVPTLDFLDFLEELSNKAKEVYIIFSDAKQKDIDIWSAKVATLKRDNIYLKVYNDT